MQRIEDIEKRFNEENANLFQYIMHSMITFHRSKSWQIEGVTDDEETEIFIFTSGELLTRIISRKHKEINMILKLEILLI